MARRNRFIGFGAGLLAGVVVTIALSGGHAVPPALAQAPPASPADLGAPPLRYQISAWARPAGYGAYILDTKSGQVWLLDDIGNLSKVVKIGHE
jgi:hypothetical protein